MHPRLVFFALLSLPAVSSSLGCWSVAEITAPETIPATLASGDAVKVTEIVKGDEVTVEKEGRTAKVRLLGVLAFDNELSDPSLMPWREASVRFLREQTLDRTVTIVLGTTAKDAHGRTLAYLERGADADKVDLNRAMVAAGLSMVYTEFGCEREADYLAVEAEARAARKGLWERHEPVALVKGLRQQWARFRLGRDKEAVNDPLLAPAPAAAAP